jgi:TPR repeat protein
MRSRTAFAVAFVATLAVNAARPIKVQIVSENNGLHFNGGRFNSAGEAAAFYSMGMQFQNPSNVVIWRAPMFPVRKPDPAATFRGVLMRAEAGSTNAMRDIAQMYRTGTGTETNEFEARVWEIRAGAIK